MRLIFVVLVLWAATASAEGRHCERAWSVGAGLSLVRAPHVDHLEQLWDFEGLGVLTCPITSRLDVYIEGGVGATSRGEVLLPIGGGVLYELSEPLFVGLSFTLNNHVYPHYEASFLLGPLFQWNVSEYFSFVFVPGFVMLFTQAERAHGGGGTLHLELE